MELYMLFGLFLTCNSLEVRIGVLDSYGGIKSRGPAVTEAIKNFTAEGVFHDRNISIRYESLLFVKVLK